MEEDTKYRTFTIFILILLIAIYSRWIGFTNPHNYTFDESLYTQMGLQLNKNPFNYNSKAVYEYCTNRGRPLPNYLNMPLFKHPPVYCYLISLSYYILNPSYLSAFIVSLVFGLVIIIISLTIGIEFFNKNVALLASLLITIDPIHWLCSEKIWMETTMTAFIWASLYFLMKAIINRKQNYFIWAGLTTGIAILTKYPAFIVFPIGFTYAFIYDREVFKSKYFWFWPLVSFVLFVPWLFWNFNIYGSNFFAAILTAHREIKLNFYLFFLYISILLLITAGIVYLIRHKTKKQTITSTLSVFKKSIVPILILGGLTILFAQPYMLQGVANMLNLKYIPVVGWKIGIFKDEPWYFYIRRIIELSPFYFIAFLGIFLVRDLKSKTLPLFIAIFWMMPIFITYGNFQSRYILPTVPAFLIISAYTITWVFKKISQFYNKKWLYIILSLILLIMLTYSFIKTTIVDLQLALPNKVCYF